jgi:hypothetical protein
MFTLLTMAQGQQANTENPTKSELNQYLSSSKKLGFTEKDSLFQVNIGFRVQSRAGFENRWGICNSRRRN